jgi:hypothetical protein
MVMATTSPRRFPFWLAAGLATLALGWFAGWFGRYHLIEPENLYRTCLAAPPPWWCEVRQRLIGATFTVRGIYGWVSLAAALAGWLLEGRLVAVCVLSALLAGGLGLELYSTSIAALGLLLGLLRLSRLDEVLAQPPKFYP